MAVTNSIMDLIDLIRLAYLGASAAVFLVAYIPALRDRFLAYGARSSVPDLNGKEGEKASSGNAGEAPFLVLLDRLADIQVPHSWFTSFYAVAVACSLIWASQIVLDGPLFRLMAYWTTERAATMGSRQVLVTWIFFTVQGSRRLYECLVFASPSKSQMWFGHWLLGIFFYMATSIAVWVEGIRKYLFFLFHKTAPSGTSLTSNHTAALQHANAFSMHDLAFTAPKPRTFLATLLFLLASGIQHDCHAYLFSLKSTSPSKDGYRLPTHPAFASLIAPHYTAECAIYLSLAILAAPQGSWMNWTLGCALVFVGVNLGVTADVTREWYARRFGPHGVEGKWRMVPWVY